MPRNAGSQQRWLVFGAAALVALFVYLPTLRYGFVWDDRVLILENHYLDQASPVQVFAGPFVNNPDVEHSAALNAYYRPIANLSFYVDRKIWGLRPAGYHLTNVVGNALVALLACFLLWELFGSVWLAGLGGLLVGIHPAMNCAVTWISDRTYLLATVFLVGSCYALLRGRRGRSSVWVSLFGISLLLGFLAHEAALAFVAVALGWLVASRARYRPFWTWLAAAALPVAVYLLLRLAVARVAFAGSVVSQATAEPLRVINTFGQQLQLLLFPFNQKVIYAPSRLFTGFSLYTVLGLLFLALPPYALFRLGSPAGRGSKRSARLTPGQTGWLGYAWMVLLLLPFANTLFLAAAGRMLYLAAPGALVLAAALYLAGSRKGTMTRVAYAALLAYTAACAAQTLRRNPVWRDEFTLSRTMVQEAPGAAGGHLNYGISLASAGRTREAVEQLRAAVSLNPQIVEAHINLAFALIDQGDLAGGIRELRQVVRLRPDSPSARNDLAVTLMRAGQPDSAIAEYREALRLAPNSEVALSNLGYLYLARGDAQQAIEVLKAALKINPAFPNARANLAAAYRAAGMPDSAAVVEGQTR
jgi:Flp pilus assembly protein TadD